MFEQKFESLVYFFLLQSFTSTLSLSFKLYVISFSKHPSLTDHSTVTSRNVTHDSSFLILGP